MHTRHYGSAQLVLSVTLHSQGISCEIRMHLKHKLFIAVARYELKRIVRRARNG